MSEEQRFRRSPHIRAWSAGDRLVLVAASGRVLQLTDDSAALARAVLDALETPHTLAEVRRQIEARAGAPLERPEVVEEAHALLRDVGAIEVSTTAAATFGASIVLGVCGAIAASDTPRLARALLARGHDVKIALTRAASRFVRPDVLARITHDEVFRGLFVPHRVPHVELAEWADLVLVAPVTATTIGRIASGDASDLVAAIALATRAPVMLAPAMHPGMATAPALLRNLQRLRDDGHLIVQAGPAVEVAHAPSARSPRGVGAPSVEALVAVVEAALRTDPRVSTLSPRAWDRAHGARELVFELEPELVAALDEHVRPGTAVLEVGCGTGTIAIAAAARGARVVGADLSENALARAREASSAVVWMRDDITATALRSSFDVIVDRGCLHALPTRARAAYAESLRRLTVPGSVALIYAHVGAPRIRGVLPVSDAEMAALFASSFAIEAGPSTAEGAGLFVLRRSR